MKNIPFFKFQGTGNDFILIDNRFHTWLTVNDQPRINKMCDRRFGIGADGLILLENKPGFDFGMVYFNADGLEGSMCGNGGRCAVALARHLSIIDWECRFLAFDGEHRAKVTDEGWVELSMRNVESMEKGEDFYIIDTGSPHYVAFVDDLSSINVVREGRAIRYSNHFSKEGINVNFVQVYDGGIKVATYERGVEDETLSCGTGVTACALAWSVSKPIGESQEVTVETKGGQLKVRLTQVKAGVFHDVWLCGPAELVFQGQYTVQ